MSFGSFLMKWATFKSARRFCFLFESIAALYTQIFYEQWTASESCYEFLLSALCNGFLSLHCLPKMESKCLAQLLVFKFKLEWFYFHTELHWWRLTSGNLIFCCITCSRRVICKFLWEYFKFLNIPATCLFKCFSWNMLMRILLFSSEVKLKIILSTTLSRSSISWK